MEEKFIKILNKKDCTGCRACEQICPVKAISMKEDDEGFITPKVDEERRMEHPHLSIAQNIG